MDASNHSMNEDSNVQHHPTTTRNFVHTNYAVDQLKQKSIRRTKIDGKTTR